MAIPIFEDFLYPFLYQLKDKDVSSKEMKIAIIRHFNLSEEDCSLKTKSGTTNQLNDRLGWCRQYLRRALMIELPARGVYRITQRGKEYLAKHNTLRKIELMQYPEFEAYANGTEAPKAPQPSTSKHKVISEELTPTDQMEQAYHEIINDLAADLLQKILGATSDFFEKLTLDLLLKMGYGGAYQELAFVTPTSHDGGVDAIISEDALGLEKIYIQAKQYKEDNSVGRPEIQGFIGALDEQKTNKGVFVTTSSFTKGAKESARNSQKKIVLIDGEALTQYMIKYGVGVSTKQVYEIKRIDSDYFEE